MKVFELSHLVRYILAFAGDCIDWQQWACTSKNFQRALDDDSFWHARAAIHVARSPRDWPWHWKSFDPENALGSRQIILDSTCHKCELFYLNAWKNMRPEEQEYWNQVVCHDCIDNGCALISLEEVAEKRGSSLKQLLKIFNDNNISTVKHGNRTWCEQDEISEELDLLLNDE